MRILRYRRSAKGKSTWGWLAEDKIGKLVGSPYNDYRRGEPKWHIDKVQLLPPVQPGKIICVGRNYAAHAAEHDVDIPDIPLLFMKPPSAVIGHGDSIHLPPQSTRVEHEGELAIVIGQKAHGISPSEAGSTILGYTAANDVTARDLQRRNGQWTRAKGFDTFCPIGPWIETDLDPADVLITCSVNGQMRQMGSTRDMIFPVHSLVAFISSIMTLNSGDVILTGTPAGVGPLLAGDEVSVEIEGLGTLTNTVEADAAQSAV